MIYIIILNWNGKDDTIECLGSVYLINYPDYKVVVVDNGSIDGSVAAIKEKFPEVIIIETGENLGFAAGNNVGIEYAVSQGANYVFLLNNDTIVDPQVLTTLIAASEKYPNAGILGSKIYYYQEPKKIWFAGAKWLSDRAMFVHLGIGQIDNGRDWEEIQETEYICGCAFFVKAEVIKKVGMFEPKYFLTWEESDWCYRAKKAGYQCLFVPSSKVWHKISASFEGGFQSPHYQYFWSRNRLLWIERNVSFKYKILMYRVILKKILYQFFKYLNPQTSKRERAIFKASLQGINDYFLRRFG